jgi:hypothetical protein
LPEVFLFPLVPGDIASGHKEPVREAIQVAEEVGREFYLFFHQPHDRPLRPSANRSGKMEANGDLSSSRKDKRGERGEGFVHLIQLSFQQIHRIGRERRGIGASVLGKNRQLRSQIKEFILNP